MSDVKVIFENSHVKLQNNEDKLVDLGKRYDIQFLRWNFEFMNIDIGFSGETIKKQMVEG